jgi:nitrite reductase/ring-hydroxylating ferredoxin subunit
MAVVSVGAPLAALGWWGLLMVRAGQPWSDRPRRLLVGPLEALQCRSTTEVRAPAGTVVRIHAPAEAGGRWLALRDECPHLGCRLDWKAASGEYVCPCHAGRFDARGLPSSGPPLAAGLAMLECDIELERGMLFLLLTGADLVVSAERRRVAEPAASRRAAARGSRRGRA